MYDTIVIGNGPAGVSAAIYLKRFNYNVMVVGNSFGALESSGFIDNYYGVPHIQGKELISRGIDQAKALGADFFQEEVVSITYADSGVGYTVKTTKNSYNTKTVFIATGKARVKLYAKKLKDFEGKGISYCAICDGFFYKNKKIGLVGNSTFMENELEVLEKFSDDITIFSNGVDYKNDNHKVVTDKITSFFGDEKLQGIETDKDKYDLDGVFIAFGTANAISFAKHLGIMMDEKNNLVVNNFQTNIPGVFAGGDVIGGLLQAAKAVGDGANASVEIKKYLQAHK